MTPTFRTSAPDAWVSPRASADPAQRMAHYGPIEPLPSPSLWRANWREIVGTAALIAGLVGAVVMGFVAMGVV